AHDVRREALDDDVRPGGESPRDVAGLGLREIEREPVLRRVPAGVELAALDSRLPLVPRRSEAHDVEPRVRLDADHGRAVVGEVLDRDRADADPGEVEDL